MTYKEMKKKTLALIEELNPNSAMLTDDPDIAAKYNEVANQVMYEMARMKKLPKYVEMPVTKGQLLTFKDIENEIGNAVYQIKMIAGVISFPKADGTVQKVMEDGTAEIECYVYPKRITDENADAYEFELSPDALEVLPYGIAGDLLKSDVSADYGVSYSKRFSEMIQVLDSRYQMTSVYIEGGVEL